MTTMRSMETRTSAFMVRFEGSAGSDWPISIAVFGADSGSVHTGLGHPGQGQTSSELHDNSTHSGGSGGLVGLKENHPQGNVADLKDDPKHAKQRNLKVDAAGTRGNTGGPPAEEMEPDQVR